MSPAPTALCLALDLDDAARARALIRATESVVDVYKIGLTTYLSLGDAFVREVSETAEVFLDLKLHDIPAQVAGAIRTLGGRGVAYTTIHASGGPDMVRAAVEAAPEGLMLLAVTVLTSLDEPALAAIGITSSPAEAVLTMAALALAAGVPGLVCSPHEVSVLRARFGGHERGGPFLVVPGIRSGATSDDQRRTLSARAAVEAGADMIVVGRPITQADDPARAAAQIRAEMGEGWTRAK